MTMELAFHIRQYLSRQPCLGDMRVHALSVAADYAYVLSIYFEKDDCIVSLRSTDMIVLFQQKLSRHTVPSWLYREYFM